MTKVRLSRSQLEQILPPYYVDDFMKANGYTDFIELEGEVVEEPYHGSVCEEYKDRGVCRHLDTLVLPPLPEETDFDRFKRFPETRLVEAMTHDLMLKVNHLIKYLRARDGQN